MWPLAFFGRCKNWPRKKTARWQPFHLLIGSWDQELEKRWEVNLLEYRWHRGHVKCWMMRKLKVVELLKAKINDLFWFLFYGRWPFWPCQVILCCVYTTCSNGRCVKMWLLVQANGLCSDFVQRFPAQDLYLLTFADCLWKEVLDNWQVYHHTWFLLPLTEVGSNTCPAGVLQA